VFLDQSVEGNQLLADSIAAQSDDAWVVLIEADEDGVERISEVLDQFKGLKSIHIVSHGSAGEVQLGNTRLNNESLAAYAGEIAQWNTSLASDADILIYGCDLAASEEGESLIESIAALTDADVAASDDVTGHADLGGDWILEYNVGDVQTEVAFGYALQTSWYGTLDIVSNLSAHYEFEENGGGAATDSTANNNDGTLINSPSWDSDASVGSFSLDFTGDAVNSNEFVSVPDDPSLDFSGDFSISFWYNSSVVQSDNTRIIGSHDGSDGFSIYANANGSLSFFAQGASASTTTSRTGGFVNDGTWHHVVAVKQADSIRLYVDETTLGAAAVVFGAIDPAAPLTIGGESATVGDYEGKLDDVRVYTRALSASDVSEAYALGAARTSYSASNGADNSLEHISNVTFAGINNSTGADTGGYGDYTGQSANVFAGSTNTLSVTISPAAQ